MSTVHARPISHAEIEALAQADARPLDCYLLESSAVHGLTLTATTLTARKGLFGSGRRGTPHKPVYLPEPDTRPNAHPDDYVADTDTVLGHIVQVATRNMFGIHSGLTLFTTEDAERAQRMYRTTGHRNPEAHRQRVYVADPDGQEMPLTPVYGAEATLGMIVKGVDPDEALRRAQAALEAEFGEALTLHKELSRPVRDRRVNVYDEDADPDKPRLLASNIIEASAHYLYAGSSYRTSEVPPEQVNG
jgi:hypothetical protein